MKDLFRWQTLIIFAVSTIASTVIGLTIIRSDVSANSKDIQEIQDDLKGYPSPDYFEEKFSNVIERIDDKTKNLEDKVNEVNSKVDNLEKKIEAVQTRVDE